MKNFHRQDSQNDFFSGSSFDVDSDSESHSLSDSSLFQNTLFRNHFTHLTIAYHVSQNHIARSEVTHGSFLKFSRVVAFHCSFIQSLAFLDVVFHHVVTCASVACGCFVGCDFMLFRIDIAKFIVSLELFSRIFASSTFFVDTVSILFFKLFISN
ncbi:hypothetical protein IKO50_00070 [bacterium]|nr:hypothetical protein [bacterium]